MVFESAALPYVVYIDPAKHFCAVAHFNRGACTGLSWAHFDRAIGQLTLQAAEHGAVHEGKIKGLNYINPDLVVIEKPNINANTPNWQSMLECAWHGALVAGAFNAPIREYEPNAWKGTVKKPPHHRRIWRAATPAEQALFPSDVPAIIEAACAEYARIGKVRKYSHPWHNFLDSMGVGFFDTGRIGRGGKKIA